MKLNPFAGSYLTNPAATWRLLLEQPVGVHFAEDLGMWLISRHEDVRRAFSDGDSFSNAMTLVPVYEVCPEALEIVFKIDAPPTTAAADAPIHPRTRRALRATFANTANRVNDQYGLIVRRRADELVSRLSTRRGEVVDLVADFTTELPLYVVMDILGVPEPDMPKIKAWADGQIALVWGQPDPHEQVRLAQGLLDFWRYCQDMVAHRLTGPLGEDFVSKALAYRDGDDEVLTEAEVASLAFNLLVAGHETTAGLLAHALDRALSTPERWAGLVTDPSSVPAFVEETLRFGPAIDAWLRMTKQEVTIGGVTIPPGQRCLLMVGAANRDQSVFAHPDRFDPSRSDVRDHLTFGYGPHFCIGASLARLEAQVALTRLAAALPGLRLAPDHRSTFKPNVSFRAHHGLPAIIDTHAELTQEAARAA